MLDVYLQALPPRHQSRRRVIKAVGRSGPPFPLCTRPAIAGLPILLAFARRKLLGRANVWLEIR